MPALQGQNGGASGWPPIPSDNIYGVWGDSSTGYGVIGTSDSHNGVRGLSTDWAGVYGLSANSNGVYGKSGGRPDPGDFVQNCGVVGVSQDSHGVYGVATSYGGFGAVGVGSNAGLAAFNSNNSNAAYLASDCCAGYFVGFVDVIGRLHKSGGGFRIDHPQDADNRYLAHSFVESDEMKNIYDGIAELDQNGTLQVILPRWFEVLNDTFRYQLTAIGRPAPNLHIAQEVAGGQFTIAGGAPGMHVSWQVTGVRKDAWANAHRIQVEEEKASEERGRYLHPELYNAAPERSIARHRHPQRVQLPEGTV